MSSDFDINNPKNKERLTKELMEKLKNHEHKFDGEVWYSRDKRTGSVTCSICGLPQIYFDLQRELNHEKH